MPSLEPIALRGRKVMKRPTFDHEFRSNRLIVVVSSAVPARKLKPSKRSVSKI
jgi:hypothetical protein